MTTLLKITMIIATDADPSQVLDEASTAAVRISEDVGGTMDEDDITSAVCVEEYTPPEGEPPPRTVGVNVEVSDERISELLCCAFEGGAAYWCRIKRYENPDNVTCEYEHLDLPFTANGAVVCVESNDLQPLDELPEWRLDRAALDRGLKLLATKHPRHWADFFTERDDADTGDVFLQLCLLGEVVYS